jgi:hypothetical protein
VISTLEARAYEAFEEQIRAARLSYYQPSMFDFRDFGEKESSFVKTPMSVSLQMPPQARDIEIIRDWFIRNESAHRQLMKSVNSWMRWNREVEGFFKSDILKNRKDIVGVKYKSKTDSTSSKSTAFENLVSFFRYIENTPLYGSDGTQAQFCKAAENAKNRVAGRTVEAIRELVKVAKSNKNNAIEAANVIDRKRVQYRELIEKADQAIQRIRDRMNSGGVTFYPPSPSNPNGYEVKHGAIQIGTIGDPQNLFGS